MSTYTIIELYFTLSGCYIFVHELVTVRSKWWRGRTGGCLLLQGTCNGSETEWGRVGRHCRYVTCSTSLLSWGRWCDVNDRVGNIVFNNRVRLRLWCTCIGSLTCWWCLSPHSMPHAFLVVSCIDGCFLWKLLRFSFVYWWASPLPLLWGLISPQMVTKHDHEVYYG